MSEFRRFDHFAKSGANAPSAGILVIIASLGLGSLADDAIQFLTSVVRLGYRFWVSLVDFGGLSLLLSHV